MLEEKITVRGIVTACEWGVHDEVTAISIAADDEQEYIVNETPTGRYLMKLLRQCVRIRGSIGKDDRGRKTITVYDFTTDNTVHSSGE